MRRTFDEWLSEYNESHQNPTNKKIHWLCVPAILFSIIGLSWQFSVPFTLFLLVLIMSFYTSLSLKLAIAMGLSLIALTAVVVLLPFGYKAYLSMFILAWIGQFYGHHLEGKKPSFFKDIQFLAVGPAWCMNTLLGKLMPKYWIKEPA